MSEMVLGISDLLVTGFEIWGLIFLMQNENRKHGKIGVFIFWILLVSCIFAMTRIEFPLFLKFICIAILITGIGKIAYSCKLFKLFFYALIYLSAMYSSEMIVIQLWNLFNEPVYSDNIIYEDFTMSIIILSKALYFFIILILEYVIKGANKRRQIKDILPVLISSIPFLVILEIINISLALTKNRSMNLVFIFGSLIVFISFIANVLITRYYWDVMDKEQQEKKSVYELQIKCDYYLKRMKDEEQVKSIYHDLKNHLLLSDESMLKSQTVKKLQMYEKYYNTGNDFLDIILADKIELAWNNGVKIECDIDFKEGGFLDPLDISTIFGNLLDNAIEATKELHESEKIIFFKIECREGLIIIVIKNHINYGVNINENILSTQKGNKQYHGFGIPNVRKGVHKYNGECSIKVYDNEFVVSIVIPIPKQKQKGGTSK